MVMTELLDGIGVQLALVGAVLIDPGCRKVR
jgi:hypothetical protein